MSTLEPAGVAAAPPPRPAWREERPAAWLFRALGPRLRRVPQTAPPTGLQPFEELRLPRQGRPGWLAATSYPAPGTPRGSVLFLHPWLGPLILSAFMPSSTEPGMSQSHFAIVVKPGRWLS